MLFSIINLLTKHLMCNCVVVHARWCSLRGHGWNRNNIKKCVFTSVPLIYIVFSRIQMEIHRLSFAVELVNGDFSKTKNRSIQTYCMRTHAYPESPTGAELTELTNVTNNPWNAFDRNPHETRPDRVMNPEVSLLNTWKLCLKQSNFRKL